LFYLIRQLSSTLAVLHHLKNKTMKKFTLIIGILAAVIVNTILAYEAKSQTWNLSCQQPLNITDSLELVKIFGKTTANDYEDWFYFDFVDTLGECRVKGIGGDNYIGFVNTNTVKLEIENFPFLKQIHFSYIVFDELSISNLSSLENITLNMMGVNNKITIKNLSILKKIDVENFYDDDFTTEWALENLPNLDSLCISNSNLAQLSYFTNFPNLKGLILENNDFIQGFSDIINLPSLELLNLQLNQLTGTIPNLENMPFLKEVNLQWNQFSGTIPNFENIPLLERLYLSSNQFSGTIPNFNNIQLLEEIKLGANNLEGSIPNFENIPLLKILDLSSNQLTGVIPNFDNLPVLNELTICGVNNEFIGPIPALENCPLLNIVNFSCVGPAPENTGSIVSESDSLEIVNFYQVTNGDSWQESEGWLTRNLEAWWGIELSDTLGEKRVTKMLIRGIPDAVELPTLNLPFLEELILDYNNFTGIIPELNNLTNLKILNLAANNFEGNLPDLSTLTQLEEINLGQNSLAGDLTNFPEQTELKILDLSSNNLSGVIPDLSANPLLTKLDLSNNLLTGNLPNFDVIPDLKELNLSGNLFEGTIPDFNAIPNLTYLNISENSLEGAMPDFSNLSTLITLNVSNNQLSSAIPDFLNLPLLEALFLNDNHLEGQLPNFSNLPELRELSVCDNQLVGLVPNFSLSPQLDISLIDFSCIQSAKVSGIIYYDANENCEFDEGDIPIPNGLISVNNGANYQPVDENGNYEVAVEIGVSVITFIQTSPLWQNTCDNTQTITSVTVNDVTELNFANEPNIECTHLTIDIGTPFLRRCFKNNYTVQYCNLGTQPAADAYIEIDFEAEIIPLSASIPYEENNNLLTFQLGEIGIGECGSFTVVDSVSCIAPLSSTGCVEAHIYPDGYCYEPSTIWDGANLKVNAFCLANDSVQFQIENLGENMLSPSQYKMYVEDVMHVQGEFQIESGAAKILNYPATGATYKVAVEQTPGHPSLDDAQAYFELCGNGNFSTGYINSQLLPDRDAFVDIDCEEIIGSYDPNDKLVTPTGVGDSNDIYEGDELTYKIRFQNTGNDTAFTVVLVDTLDVEYLDISTIEVLNSSHPYTLAVEDAQILTFTFNNILLVDSTKNEPESHGFVTFKIDQNTDNQIGDVIENKADIYFDYNEAIVTPTVFNTLSEPTLAENYIFIPLTVSIENQTLNHLFAKVYPNPATEVFFIELPGEVLHQYPNLQLEMYNTKGQAVLSQSLNQTQQSINVVALENGIHYYKLFSENQIVANGKLLIQ